MKAKPKTLRVRVSFEYDMWPSDVLSWSLAKERALLLGDWIGPLRPKCLRVERVPKKRGKRR